MVAGRKKNAEPIGNELSLLMELIQEYGLKETARLLLVTPNWLYQLSLKKYNPSLKLILRIKEEHANMINGVNPVTITVDTRPAEGVVEGDNSA